tara:strand:+ start:181 stop:804 length:624 start_codon:yes stop_codon:yes gene_type:complete
MKPELKFDVIDGGAFTWVNGVKGCLRETDVKIITDCAKNISFGGKYVEIGSWLGCSALLVAFHCPGRCKVYCHDLWEDELSPDSNPLPVEENVLYKFHKNIMDNDMEDIITPIRGDSSTMVTIHDDKSIDLAFVDGDHSYDGVMKDLEALYPKMKSKSIILCHDSDAETEALRALVDFCNAKNITDVRGFSATDMKMIIIDCPPPSS